MITFSLSIINLTTNNCKGDGDKNNNEYCYLCDFERTRRMAKIKLEMEQDYCQDCGEPLEWVEEE